MLADALHRVPTETEEAIMLHKADLDEMTSKLIALPMGGGAACATEWVS